MEDSFFYDSGITIGLWISYLLLFVAATIAVVFPVLDSIKNPKEVAKSGISVVGLVVFFIVSYALSGSEITAKYMIGNVTTEFESKMIGAGLIMFYFVLFLSIIAMVFSEISKALK